MNNGERESSAWAMRSQSNYPDGPRNEEAAILAAKEANADGLLTGGPRTPAEWRHWNAAREAGWPGRWPVAVAWDGPMRAK